MRSSFFKWVCLGLWSCILPTLLAQDLEDYLSRYGAKNGEGYLQPLGDAFCANLNSGLFHSAHISTMGVHLGLDLVAADALIGREQKTFRSYTEDPFYPASSHRVPTVFGKNEPLTVDGGAGTAFTFPGGFEVDQLPLLVPQLSIGSLFGTELCFRYFAYQLDKEIGDLSLIGIGVRHSISQYLPLLPVDIAAAYFHQNFSLGDVVEARTDYIGIQVSRSLSVLTVYGGAGYENASMSISYERGEGDDRDKVTFDISGQNSMRLTIGAALRLAVFRLHADYNLAAQSVFSVGLHIGN